MVFYCHKVVNKPICIIRLPSPCALDLYIYINIYEKIYIISSKYPQKIFHDLIFATQLHDKQEISCTFIARLYRKLKWVVTYSVIRYIDHYIRETYRDFCLSRFHKTSYKPKPLLFCVTHKLATKSLTRKSK